MRLDIQSEKVPNRLAKGNHMQITHIASFLIYPGKNLENPPEVKGTMVPLSGRLFNMLNVIFEKSDSECDIPIRFVMAEDGSQNNEARNDMLAYIESPTLDRGGVLAKRMRDFTTQKPGLALFFLILGSEGNNRKIVLSRFPADEGILAEPHEDTLQVEFIERIFMKNAKSYKAALYKGSSLRGDFWKGSAVDKQINESNHQIANYWIHGFLASDFETTSKAGTKRLAVAIREASKKASNLGTKQQLVAFATLARGVAGQSISINDMAERYSLTEDAKETLISQLPYRELANDSFILDANEFSQHVAYASVELDNGGILIAPPDRFDDCFQREYLNDELHTIRFVTEGQIVDEKIKGRK